MEGLRIPAALLSTVPITTIHRDKDSYVAFGRKNASRPHGWENLGSIKVDEIERLLPGFADYLFKDAYFSVNSFYHPAPHQREAPLNLPRTIRSQTLLQRLNCCYADLDVGRQDAEHPYNMDVVKAQSRAFVMMQTGLLPKASIFVLTGQGLNLHWILKDSDDPHLPPRAWPEKVERWKQVNEALSQRLTELAADPSVSRDPVRVFRVPGSINTKTDHVVDYMIRYDEQNQIITYTLEELAEVLSVPSLRSPRLQWHRQTKEPGSVPNRRKGYEAVNAKRIDDLLTIEQARGGFLKRGLRYADGTESAGRLKVLTIYAITLRHADYAEDEALEAIKMMAENCQPPYPSDPNDTPIKQIVAGIYQNKYEKRLPWTNAKICDQLKISPEMAERIKLQTIIPPELRRKRDAEKYTRPKAIADRRATVLYLFTEHNIRSCRKLQKTLALHNYDVSLQTVANDLTALGITSTHRGGRPKKTKEQSSLFHPVKQAVTLESTEDPVALAAQQKLLARRKELKGKALA